jgi:hypothetical protein
MGTAYLVGNGINRVGANGPSWQDILEELTSGVCLKKLDSLTAIPFPLVFHELIGAHALRGRTSRDLRGRVGNIIRKLRGGPLHQALMNRKVAHVLTTNYDQSLESSVGEVGPCTTWEVSEKYSLFRHRVAAGVRVWHIHGDVDPARSILMGYDHYSGALQRMRLYVKSEYHERKSPFKRGIRAFECDGKPYSWVDVFLRDDVHILGLTLDYSEIDVWWLLTYKDHLRRHGGTVGKTIYWSMQVQGDATSDVQAGHIRMLGALGVTVCRKDVSPDDKGWQHAWTDLIAGLPAA